MDVKIIFLSQELVNEKIGRKLSQYLSKRLIMRILAGCRRESGETGTLG